MKLSISKDANPNYLAKVVSIKILRPHSNADKLQLATIDGNNIVVGIDTRVGDYGIYCPLESCLSIDFLTHSNMFKDNGLNANIEARPGFFEYHGRIKAVKLRGEKSQGFWFPMSILEEFVGNNTTSWSSLDNQEFDSVNDVLLIKKYIPRGSHKNEPKEGKQGKKGPKRQSKIVDHQFRFHYDTSPLGKNIHRLSPEDIIAITYKLHGTSFISSNILCRRKLSIIERIAKFFGAKIESTIYDNVYSSRKVIKNKFMNSSSNHYYNYDIWGEINETLRQILPQGITVYGEAVGFTKGGSYIQRGYDYGVPTHEFKSYIYRVTYTNTKGNVFEFSWQQVKDFCERFGLTNVPEMYYGKAKHLFPLDVGNHWHENFLAAMQKFFLEKDCYMCKNPVPEEGIVLRIEKEDYDAFKLKSFRFSCRESDELDSQDADIESIESVEEN